MSTGNVVDPDFLAMFSFPLLNGNAATALNDPHSIVITKMLANKLFNTEDAMGKTIRMGDAENYIVTGIFERSSRQYPVQLYRIPVLLCPERKH